MQNTTRIGVVVVNYNMTVSCSALVSELLNNQGINCRNLVVIDNSYNLELKANLSERLSFENVVVAKNLGYGAAMNLGVSLLPESVDTIVLLTHEVVLQESALQKLAWELTSLPDVAILGPTLMNLADGNVWSVGGNFSSIRNIPYHLKSISEATARGVRWLDGACLVMHRDTWNEVGGFDPNFFLYFEDIDLCLRIAKSTRKRVSVSSEVKVWQEPGGNLTHSIVNENFPYFLIKSGNYKAAVAWIFVRCLIIALGTLTGSDKPKSFQKVFAGVSKGINYRKGVNRRGR